MLSIRKFGNKPYLIFLFYLVIVLLGACTNDETTPDSDIPILTCDKPPDIIEKIQALGVASVTEMDSRCSYKRIYRIDVTQPVDHSNPDGAKFTQRVYLRHVDENLPMNFAPSGYTARESFCEISGLFDSNLLSVAHRYFINARPDPLDWRYLTIKQSADDLHEIVSLFKQIYHGKWISSGASKGGLTVLFHRRYYPEDVDATIAYAAPFMFGSKDQRFPEYLKNIGGGEFYPRLTQIQRYVLEHKSEILPLIDKQILNQSSTYSLDRELMLELCVIEYPFVIWQNHSVSSSSLPDTTTSSPKEIFDYINLINPISSYSDEHREYFKPYYYQALTELGAPAIQTDHLSDLLTKIDPDAEGNPDFEINAPADQNYSFNFSTMIDIYQWLQTQGDRIIYIYGKNDPFSAGAIELSESVDAVFIMQDGENHGVTISSLDNREVVYDTIERWLNIEIDPRNYTPLMNIADPGNDVERSLFLSPE